MSKSNRRRKLDRAKRAARDSQQEVATWRRRAVRQTIDDVAGRFRLLTDPDTPPAELADLFSDVYGDDPMVNAIVIKLREFGWQLERLTEVAGFMLASGDSGDGEPSLAALTFAAQVAQAADDAASARELLDRALVVMATSDSAALWCLAAQLRDSGRLADAIEVLEATLRNAPHDDFAAERHGEVICQAYLRVNGQQPDGDCPCGKGPVWDECCGPRERAALSRFTDRSGLIALTDAVSAFVSGSEHGRAVDDLVDRRVASFDHVDREPGNLASLRALLSEHAVLTVRSSRAVPEPGDDQEEDETDSPLRAFAADASTPGDLAARADAWLSHAQYGLWKVESAPAAPGLWCTDICTGLVRYADFPAGFTDDWPRWSVWLGAVIPVDGIWRATGRGLRLSPAEADAAAELIDRAVTSVIERLASGKKPSRRPADPMLIGQAEPYGVLVEDQDPQSPDLALTTGLMAGHLLARIAGEIHQYRSTTPPAPRGTDGDEPGQVVAEIAVNDSERVADHLAASPGFERHASIRTLITWFGLRIPETRKAGILAEAELRASWLPDAEGEESDVPARWQRGTLFVGDGKIIAEFNSAEQLERLVGVLSKAGADPVVISASSGGAWEKHWLDEELPLLGGQTPRQAAGGQDWPWLEALLRQFEYEADLLAAHGQSGADTDWLRQELDLPEQEAVAAQPESA